MSENIGPALHACRKAHFITVAYCSDPICQCGKIAVVLRDDTRTPFALGSISSKIAREIARELNKAADIQAERQRARSHGCQGRA